MKKLTFFIIISGILSAAGLIAGAPSNLLVYLVLLMIMAIALIVFRNQTSFWLPTICFSIYSAIAIWVILQQSISFLLISGQLFAFATWELLVFRKEIKGALHSQTANQLINQHLRTLIPVILIAWITSFLFLNIQIKLPFLVILLSGGLGVFGFFRFFRASSQQ